MLNWFRKRRNSNNARGSDPLVGEIYNLKEFLEGQFSTKDPIPASLINFTREYLAKEEADIINQLPEFYLQYEQFLTEIGSRSRYTLQGLRKQVKKNFPQLITLNHFGFIFGTSEYQKEILLCKLFLDVLLNHIIRVLGQVQESFFENARSWVTSLPYPEKGFPPLHNANHQYGNLKEELAGFSFLVNDTLRKKMGDAFAQKAYDSSYNNIARNYKYLNSFPIIISLIPKRYLDTDKIGLLSKHQLSVTLLEKVSYFEDFNVQLVERNLALNKARRDIEVAQKKVEDAYLLLQEVMNAVKDGIITADENSKIIMVNKEVERIWGYRAEDLIGKPLTILMPEKHRRAHTDGMNNFLETGKSTVMHRNLLLEGLRSDGQVFPIEINISELEFAKKPLFTAAVRDITTRLKVETTLRESKEQLEQRTHALEEVQLQLEETIQELQDSNLELKRFAYVASHDLQEPLRSIEGYMKLIRKTMEKEQLLDHEALAEYINFASQGTKRMRNLIKDLLEYSRIGRTNLEVADISMEKLLTLVQYNLSQSIEEAKAKIEIGHMPDQVIGLKSSLTQLFQNLISNAVKFQRPEQPPVIKINHQETEDSWHFTVEDNGIGIAKKDHERIFDIFQRLHKVDQYPGTGIGLAICRKIVELHGGKIWVEPSDMGGSCFHFTLKKQPAFVREESTA